MSRATRAALVTLLVASLWSSAAAAQDTTTPPAPKTTAIEAPPADTEPAEPIQGELKLTQRFAITGGEEARATVGTPMVLTLEVLHPAGTLVALPKEHPSGRFELLGVERDPDPPGADPITETIRMTFAVYRPGRHLLEPFEISVMDPEGRISVLKTDPVEVRVESVLADVKDVSMPALRAPVSVWHEDWTLVGVLSAIGVLALGVLLGAWLRRRWQPEEIDPGPPPRPAYEVAKEKLTALQNEDLIEDERFEEFYIRVSETVREYLGRRYNLSLTDQAGLELTTAEIVGLLREIAWPRGLSLLSVEQLLYDCDVVKFARYTPSNTECDDLFDRAWQLVELTRPIMDTSSNAEDAKPGEGSSKAAPGARRDESVSHKATAPDAQPVDAASGDAATDQVSDAASGEAEAAPEATAAGAPPDEDEPPNEDPLSDAEAPSDDEEVSLTDEEKEETGDA